MPLLYFPESPRELTESVRLPRFKDYYKDIGRAMKAFDVTHWQVKGWK